MAISLSSSIIKSNSEKALKDLQKNASKAAKGESKRKGLSSILGTAGGIGANMLLTTIFPQLKAYQVLKPLISGLVMSGAKGFTDIATKGNSILGNLLKTPGQTGKIASSSEYGYGAEEAGDIQEALQESRDATSWTPQSMLEDVALSYLSAGVGGDLEGVGKKITDKIKLPFLPETAGEVVNPVSFDPTTLYEQGSTGFRYPFENGGMIPKYKKGGGIFGFGKKGKEPERDEALMVLDTILSSQLPKGEYKRKGRGGNTIRQDVMPYSTDKGQSRWKGRQIAEFATTEGTRYYAGEGTSQDMQVALTKAMMNAFSRKELSPADSITTDQLAKLKELGLFMGGGKVDMDNSNTLYDYFAAQGKTMGGSDTMSIAQKLGRK